MAAFLVCYYGRWPAYWALWAASAARNPQFDFIVVTDLPAPGPLPANLRLVHVGHADLVRRFERAVGFGIRTPSPHKLCDFRPFFGLTFPDLLHSYPYWGYCDVDLVFGNLSPLVREVEASRVDVISPWLHTVGHCTLLRNEPHVNEAPHAIPHLQTRLQADDVTFCEEGAFSETCIQQGGLSFKGAHIEDEWALDRCFLGVTTRSNQHLAGLEAVWPYSIRCDELGVRVTDGRGRTREVLYFHFMGSKARRFWNGIDPREPQPFTWYPFGAVPLNAEDSIPAIVRLRSEVARFRGSAYDVVRGLLPAPAISGLRRIRSRLKA